MKCQCGSDKEAESYFDGYGCYLFRACEDCYEDKRRRYRDDIFEKYECDEPIEPDE